MHGPIVVLLFQLAGLLCLVSGCCLLLLTLIPRGPTAMLPKAWFTYLSVGAYRLCGEAGKEPSLCPPFTKL
jgi:hypothetical protein